MNTLKILLIKFKLQKVVVFIFASILITSCKVNSQTSQSLTKIKNGNLILELNNDLQTKITTSFLDAEPLSEDFQSSERLVIENVSISKFKLDSNIIKEKLEGDLPGEQWILKGIYNENGLNITKKLTLKIYDNFPNLISTQVTYTNNSEDAVFINKWINNGYTILSKNDTPLFWAFQGSSTKDREDWIKPIETGYYQRNFMGMNDTDYGGGIPVTSVWRTDINIAVGHLALVPKQVSLPTEIPTKSNNINIAVTKNLKNGLYLNRKRILKLLKHLWRLVKEIILQT